ncbi:hypothetical protein DM46_1246 [Burkholderia mallei]|nr:hypothetical protein DM46_1246 [Burkholderia mallei]
MHRQARRALLEAQRREREARQIDRACGQAAARARHRVAEAMQRDARAAVQAFDRWRHHADHARRAERRGHREHRRKERHAERLALGRASPPPRRGEARHFPDGRRLRRGRRAEQMRKHVAQQIRARRRQQACVAADLARVVERDDMNRRRPVELVPLRMFVERVAGDRPAEPAHEHVVAIRAEIGLDVRRQFVQSARDDV